MTTLAKLELSDYMKIAALVNQKVDGNENGTYEIEYQVKGYTVYIEIEYEANYSETTGGSFEGYDFERCAVLESERYGVTYKGCTLWGDEVHSDFNEKKLSDLLN